MDFPQNLHLSPGRLAGSVRVPSSKSAGHRALICAALAPGESRIYGIDMSDDMTATISALRTFGALIEPDEQGCLIVRGITRPSGAVVVDCIESGSTLRFLIPVAAALGIPATFIGRGRLPERPVGEYIRLFEGKGASLTLENGRLPLTISGKLCGGTFEVSGDITSQYITGLLLALPLLEGDSELLLTSPLESAPYVEMTLDVMRTFGASVLATPKGWVVSGDFCYSPTSLTVEGDFSQAAFFACGAALGGCVEIRGLSSFTSQGDFAVVELLNRFGAKCRFEGTTLVAEAGELCGIDIDGLQIPDLLPVLAVVGACARGTTRIYNAGRLRLKESDRITAVCSMINAIGGQAEETPDGMVIHGQPTLRGGNVSAVGDHRIAMSAAIAALRCREGLTVDDMSCISKSYPAFLEDYQGLFTAE